LDIRSFSYYDIKAKQWRAEPSSYPVLVGTSSDQIELTGDVELLGSVSSEENSGTGGVRPV